VCDGGCVSVGVAVRELSECGVGDWLRMRIELG